MVNTEDLGSLSEWADFYRREAEQFLQQTHLQSQNLRANKRDLRAHLDQFIRTATDDRAARLASSGTYSSIVNSSARAGQIPGGKLLARSIGAGIFVGKSMNAFGLAQDGQLLNNIWDIAVKAKLIQLDPEEREKKKRKKELKNYFQDEAASVWLDDGVAEAFYNELVEDFGTEIAEELIHEAAHIVPVLGQIYNAFRGAHKANKKLQKVIAVTKKKAVELHQNVLRKLVLEMVGTRLQEIERLRSRQKSEEDLYSGYIPTVATAPPRRSEMIPPVATAPPRRSEPIPPVATAPPRRSEPIPPVATAPPRRSEPIPPVATAPPRRSEPIPPVATAPPRLSELDASALKMLSDSGHDTKSQKGCFKALIWACEMGHEAVVRLLFEKGADVEAKTMYGWTALMFASDRGHEAVVRLLLNKGAYANATTNLGETALAYASQNGWEAVARLLLENGADVNMENDKGETALMQASDREHMAVARLLDLWSTNGRSQISRD